MCSSDKLPCIDKYVKLQAEHLAALPNIDCTPDLIPISTVSVNGSQVLEIIEMPIWISSQNLVDLFNNNKERSALSIVGSKVFILFDSVCPNPKKACCSVADI